MSHLLAQAAGEQNFGLLGLLPWLAIFGIFYFIVFAPMIKKQKAHQSFLDELDKGARVITNGGLYGEVTRVEGGIVTLKLNDTVKVRISKQAIAGLQGTPAEKND